MISSIIWIAVAALGAVAVLLLPLSLFDPIVWPLLWVVGILYIVAGFALVLAPVQTRRFGQALLKPSTLRTLGLITFIVSAALVRAAKYTDLPLFIQIIGVLGFFRGGVQVARPEAASVMLEGMLDLSNTWYRLFGVVCFVLAALVLVAVGYIQVGEEPVVLPEDADTPALLETSVPETAPAPEAVPTPEAVPAPEAPPAAEAAPAPEAVPAPEAAPASEVTPTPEVAPSTPDAAPAPALESQ